MNTPQVPPVSDQDNLRRGARRRRSADAGCTSCAARHHAVCANVSLEDMSALESSGDSLQLAAGATLAAEGAPRREVFTVTSGMLRRTRLLPDGRRLVAGFLLPGDFIGFTGASHYRHTIEAVTDCSLCAFSLPEMKRLCALHPQLEAGLLEQACAELDATRANLMALARMNPVERLASFLLDLSARQRARGGDADRVHLPMTRADIADHLGLTIETVSRSFTRLRNEGMIAFADPHHIQLSRVEPMREMIGHH